MHDSVKKFKNIISSIKSEFEEEKLRKIPKIIAVSKTFDLEKIIPLNHIFNSDKKSLKTNIDSNYF